MCTYNGARFILEQLQSILNQSVPVQRLSIHDDQSSDNTVEIAKRFIRDNLPLTRNWQVQVNDENLGYARNFAKGIKESTESIIFFSDQDDIWEEKKVEALLQLLSSDEVLLAFSDGILIDDNGRQIDGPTVLDRHRLPRAERGRFASIGFNRLLRANCINGASMAVRRETALAALPVGATHPHDYWIALQAAASSGCFCVDQVLYRYRQHGGNVIGLAARTNWLWQMHGIYSNPVPPRQKDMARTRELAARLVKGSAGWSEVKAKELWLESVISGPRLTRLARISASLARGRYRRWAPPYAALFDLTAAVRGL
jgi:glycosyltransferase involved in cell wall biosynthesis